MINHGTMPNKHKFVWHEAPRTIYTAQIDYLNKWRNYARDTGTNMKIGDRSKTGQTAINHDDVNILKHIFGSKMWLTSPTKPTKNNSDYHNFLWQHTLPHHFGQRHDEGTLSIRKIHNAFCIVDFLIKLSFIHYPKRFHSSWVPIPFHHFLFLSMKSPSHDWEWYSSP